MNERYLITGVAGSGKTTLERIFRDKGYVTTDIDDGFAEWRHAETDELLDYMPDDPAWHEVAEWVVDTDKLQRFFDDHEGQPILVFGSFARQGSVVDLFDTIFLLKYPDEATVRARIAGRVGGYGKNPHELARIISYVEPYQQKMIGFGAQVIDCTLPIDDVVESISAVVRADR